MRKSLIVLATLVPLLGLGGIAAVSLPALAESDDDTCAAAPAGFVAGPIDLEAIPTQQVTGPLTVRGTANCDDDDDHHSDGRGEHRDRDGDDD
ncbi:MAG TPA: hypothetical protein VIN06_07445 [Devosia sp.]